MSEVLLLSLPRKDGDAADRAARQGDRDAIVFLEGLFGPYRDREIPCFLCDTPLPPTGPLYSSIVGDLADAKKVVAVPLCAGCGELPQMVKWSRVLKMHQARTGKDVHYQLRRH